METGRNLLFGVLALQADAIFHRSSLANALRGLGRAEAAAGQPAEALATLERAAEVDGSLADAYPGCRMSPSCSLALMVPLVEPGRREALAGRAVEELRRAIGAGYSNIESLRADPDLVAIRGREDFETLQAGAGAGR